MWSREDDDLALLAELGEEGAEEATEPEDEEVQDQGSLDEPLQVVDDGTDDEQASLGTPELRETARRVITGKNLPRTRMPWESR